MRISDWSSDVCSSDLLAALLLQPRVEGIPCRKLGDRHHEVAPAITDEALDIPLVIAFPWTTITIQDQVMGQEAAEQRRTLACAVGQDLRHKAPVVVVDDRLDRKSVVEGKGGSGLVNFGGRCLYR